jgi:hypothetical protein
MKKLLTILLLFPLGVCAQWTNVPGAWQRTTDTKQYRFDMGANGTIGIPTWPQLDSLIATIGGGGGTVASVTNFDGSLTISPTAGAVIASVNLAHPFTWVAPNIWGSSMKATGLTTGTPANYLGQDAAGNFIQIPPLYYTSQFNGLGTFASPLGIVRDNNPAYASANGITSGGVYNALLYARNAANFGQTGSEAVVAQVVDPGSGDNTYRVGCWINLLSVSGGDGLTIQVTYEDEHSVSKTKTYYVPGSTTASMTTADDYPFPTMDFRVLSGSTITISTTVTGSGSILYDAGATIQLITGH